MKKMLIHLTLIALGLGALLADGIEPLGDPRQVSTLDHLFWISTNSSSWSDDFIQTDYIDASDTDTWNSSAGFSQIGNSGTEFTGSYDGGGHIIDGLTIDRPTTPYIGLFGIINGATIQNLGITDIAIVGTYFVGGVVGKSSISSTITNCYSTGSVSGNYHVGGLVGYNDNSNVSNSYSTVTVSGSQNVGGLMGYNINNSTVSYSYSTGTVTGSNQIVGGLVGYNYDGSIITKCYSTGSVSAAKQRAGGLVGYNYGSTISNSFSSGDVTRLSGSSTEFGAFCGINTSTIEYCYSIGSVTYFGATDPTDRGFSGFPAGIYTNNFWDSDVSNQTSAIGATANTTAQMKTQSTFTNVSWDFTTIWKMVDVDYPTLIGPKTFTVNSTNDVDDGTCDAAHCSLREAINAANTNYPFADMINFNIPGSGPYAIQPLIHQPFITDPVIIDARTQPDYNGTPVIEIDGSQIGYANGLEITAGNSTVRGLVINNCGAAGIYIHGNGGNKIQGNYLGTDITGTLARNNNLSGVHLMDIPNNIIGGSLPGLRNVISGNTSNGIWIEFPNAIGNIIQGNYIGLAASGVDPLGNGAFGVKIRDAYENKVGGALPGEGNIISANGKHGILINLCGAGSNNIVQGNYIGTDKNGDNANGNGWSGVVVLNSEDALIGGTETGARNIISANWYGVRIFGNDSHNNLVQGNYIGTDFSGMIALPNRSAGVYISEGAYNNTIGGIEEGTDNLISGNNRAGVYIGFSANNNRVQGNLIGTDKSGVAPLGNTTDGIAIFQGANDNTVGGDEEGAGNIIAFNASVGVLLDNIPSPVRNRISRNSIFYNGDLGIDLSLSTVEPFTDGVTINDVGDIDGGPNGFMNYPILTSALIGTGKLNIEGTIDCIYPEETTIEFFSNTECDPTGYGEGEIYIGSTVPDNTGKFMVEFTDIPDGSFIAATATDPDNNTSEFSECAIVSLLSSSSTSTVDQGETESSETYIPDGMSSETFTTEWPGSDVVMTLITPSGRVITRNTSADDVEHGNGPTFEYYTITDPEPGDWTIELFGADIPIGEEEVSLTVTGVPTEPIQAMIVDIKPEDDNNTINCKNMNGVIPVAILTTDEFDATSIDHTTARFGRYGSEAAETHVNKKSGEVKRHEEDVDHDGDMDLVFHFVYGETNLGCDDEFAALTGSTYDGMFFTGADHIQSASNNKSVQTPDGHDAIPFEFALKQPYPNPFNPYTTINYALPEPSKVIITIYDISGRKVRELINNNESAGDKAIIWDGFDDNGKMVSGGIYIYHLKAGEYSSSKKMLFLK